MDNFNRWMDMLFLGILLSTASVEGIMGCIFALSAKTTGSMVHWAVAGFFAFLFYKAQRVFNERYR